MFKNPAKKMKIVRIVYMIACVAIGIAIGVPLDGTIGACSVLGALIALPIGWIGGVIISAFVELVEAVSEIRKKICGDK